MSNHTTIEVAGYSVVGDPSEKETLFPAAEATLATTNSDDIIYLGVNPLTTGSELSGMYIDLKELAAAVNQLQNNQRLDAT